MLVAVGAWRCTLHADISACSCLVYVDVRQSSFSRHVSADLWPPSTFHLKVAREASKRVLGLRPFDTQLIGGMILHEGQIAEMRTGEGKTLVAVRDEAAAMRQRQHRMSTVSSLFHTVPPLQVLPAYLNALTGKGVHVVTVNDYLARRDSECVGQVHR